MSETPPVLLSIALIPVILAFWLLIQIELRRALGIYYKPKTATEFCELVARKAGCCTGTVWQFFHDNKIQVGDPAYDWSEWGAERIANELREDY
jgi:hypothetical protein